MFTNTKKLQAEIDSLNEEKYSIQRKHADEMQKRNEEHEYKLTILTEKHLDEVSRLQSNQDVVIEKQTTKLNEQISELTIKTQTQTKEIEMYSKAFENLGFDVKDMKEILNKLVDGLIAKNEIKIVK